MEDRIFDDSWGDLDDGKESVWCADWIIDLNQSLSTVKLTINYKDTNEFQWSYEEIKDAFDGKTVKEFLEKYISEPVSDDDLKEVTDFFFHWLSIVESGGNIEFDVDDADLIEVGIDEKDF